MDPVHRLIISSDMLKWFKWVDKAHRTIGGIYEIDTQKLFQSYPALKYATKGIKSALFLLVKVQNSKGKYYLTIIDRDIKDKIKKYSWHLQNATNYWHTNRVKKPLLHQYVVYLSGEIVPSGHVIHHARFYTFDNRLASLKHLPIGEHTSIHNGPGGPEIAYSELISNDEAFEGFITSVF